MTFVYLKLTSSPKPQTPNPKSKKENKNWKDNNGVPMNCCISFPWSRWIIFFIFIIFFENRSRWIYIDTFCNFQRLLWNGKMTHAHLSSDTSPFSLTLWFFGHYRLQFQVIFNYIVILLSFFFGILILFVKQARDIINLISWFLIQNFTVADKSH